MKVQRAPRASAQPQKAPDGYSSRRADGRSEAASSTATTLVAEPAGEPHGLFSAGIDLDLTAPLKRLDESAVVAEIVANLMFACRHEGVASVETAIRLLRPTADGLVGVVLPPRADQSVQSVGEALAAPAVDLPPSTSNMLTVIHIGATRARPTGDWGLGGIGVATLGPVVPTIVSYHSSGDSSLGIAERLLSHLDLTVTDAGLHAHGAVRALDILARAVEGPER